MTPKNDTYKSPKNQMTPKIPYSIWIFLRHFLVTFFKVQSNRSMENFNLGPETARENACEGGVFMLIRETHSRRRISRINSALDSRRTHLLAPRRSWANVLKKIFYPTILKMVRVIKPWKREMPGQSAPFFWHFLGSETDREIAKCRVKRTFKNFKI